MLSSIGSQRSKLSCENEKHAKPYCQCWSKRDPVLWKQLSSRCTCGEDSCYAREWNWEQPNDSTASWVVVSEDQKQVTFHPFYSSGTAAIKGDTPMVPNHHYYWEVKMLTDTYGTDIMVGLGTNKVNMADSQYKFTSLLGQDSESYGLSYTGVVRHNATVARDSAGFCRGTIVGVRVDLWQGTLEFFINRKAQGISFYNLRRHEALFPMMSSTAAQSSMRLIYATSHRASLLVDAAKTLASSVRREAGMKLPPGLWNKMRSHFWLTLTYAGSVLDGEEDTEIDVEMVPIPSIVNRWRYAGRSVLTPTTRSPLSSTGVELAEVLPSQYMNGFYVDNVEPDYRVAVLE